MSTIGSFLIADAATGGDVATDIAASLSSSDAPQQAAAPAPPPVITIDSAEAQAAQAAARERQRRAARAAGGRSGTILTSPLGLTAPPDNTISKTILGG